MISETLRPLLTSFFLQPNQANFDTFKYIYQNSGGADRSWGFIQGTSETLEWAAKDPDYKELAQTALETQRTAQSAYNSFLKYLNVTNGNNVSWQTVSSVMRAFIYSLNPELSRRLR